MYNKKLASQIACLTLVVALLLAACAKSTEPLNTTSRGYTSMAYDVESDRGILFGGQTGNYTVEDSFNGETWAYYVAANKWTEMKPVSGSIRRAAAELAYDAESDRVIIFGGLLGLTLKPGDWETHGPMTTTRIPGRRWQKG